MEKLQSAEFAPSEVTGAAIEKITMHEALVGPVTRCRELPSAAPTMQLTIAV